MRKATAAVVLAAVGGVLGGGSSALGGKINGFYEDFDASSRNWRDATELNDLDWFAAGGPDGGAYVSTSYLVPDPVPPLGAILFRGEDQYDSSNDNFVGNWITDGVSEFSFWVRHDAFAPLAVFARFAAPANSPGAVGLFFIPVAPNQWTEIVIPIFEGSPNIILEGASFADTFSNIGNVQIGIMPDSSFIGASITVDLDKASITPAPGALAMLGLAGLAGARRRRVRAAV